jgi:predicted DsbA family dithiol-disulfide isomerase
LATGDGPCDGRFNEVEERVKVEIWSDVVCPWCYIGKRRFEAAWRGSPTATR